MGEAAPKPSGGGAPDTRAPQSRAIQSPFRRGKRKRPEARGGAGIEKCLEDRMNAGFLLIHYEKYR